MKTTMLFSILTASALILSACGKYEKQPVSDIEQLRSQAKTQEEADQAEAQEKVRVQQELERREQEVETAKKNPQEKVVYVEKEKPVYKEQATIDQNSLILTPAPKMVFVEGAAGSFQIRARSLIAKSTVSLAAKNLPQGAKLEKSNKEADLYTLTWTPSLYTVAMGETFKTFDVKLTVAGTSGPLNGIVREQEITLWVLRTQALPSELTIQGLGSEVLEGSVVNFQVVVKIPGIDGQTPKKPILIVSPETATSVAGVDYIEQGGSQYVFADNAAEAKYLGDSKWKFSMTFDTQKVAINPEFDKRGQVLTAADGTHVRMNFMVLSPFGTVTPQVLKQVKIVYNRPLHAPRFDFSSLKKDTWELTPGEKAILKFSVQSAIAKSDLKLDLPNLSTLPGTPSLTCQASKKSSLTQECVIQWNVPCDVQDKDLAQEIALSATAISSGRNSDPVQYILKTSRSARKAAKACAPTTGTKGGAEVQTKKAGTK